VPVIPAERAGPRVVLVGGPDVDARVDLMAVLSDEFEVSALGTEPALGERFATAGFRYGHYGMTRGVDPLSDLKAYRHLKTHFEAVRPQVVHTFDTKPGVWARLAAASAGVPVVVGTLPGLGSLYADRSFRNRLVRTVYQPLQRRACTRSNCTIFQNDDDRHEFVARRIVAADRSVVIRGSGVRPELYDHRRHAEQLPALRAELGIAPDRVVVTMVSRVMRTKGVLEYAEAAGQVRSHNPEVVFLLVGGADDTELNRLTPAEVDGVRQAVRWLGPRTDVPALLALSDLFVLPSIYREGVPRVLLEAAAAGLPLVVARAPGSTDVVQDGENGLVVPPRDATALAAAIERLVQDGPMRRRCGERARERVVREFSLDVVAGQIRELYRRLLREGR
jgi:glycosyltransferase involved in cell wall biosynthesis